MYPIPPLESIKEDREPDYVHEYAPRSSLWPLFGFLALLALVLVAVLIWD